MIGLVIYTLSKEFGINEVLNTIKSVKVGWLMPAMLCMSAFSVCEAINIGHGLKLAGVKTTFKHNLKYALSGFFFSSITPSASGGQPAQLYYMHKDGINISHGSFALMFELIGYEIASIFIALCGLFVLLFGRIDLLSGSSLTWLLVVGFAVNFIFLTGLLLIMFSKRAVKLILKITISIVSVFNKNPDVKLKLLRTFAEYRNTAEKVKENKAVLLKVIGTSFLQFISYHSITFFVYSSFGLDTYTFLEIMCLQGLLFTSVSCIPLPGSAGAMEGGFMLLFKNIFSSSILGSAVLLCRLINFALPLIVSGIYLLILTFKKRACAKEKSGTREPETLLLS